MTLFIKRFILIIYTMSTSYNNTSTKINNCDKSLNKLRWFYNEIKEYVLFGKPVAFSFLLDDSNHYRTISTLNKISENSISRLLAIASLVIHYVENISHVSLRDVYYCSKNIFNDQSQCNSTILLLGSILKMTREEMKIFPASKGLVSGHIYFKFDEIRSESQYNNLCLKHSDEESLTCLCSSSFLIDWKWTHVAHLKLHPNRDDMHPKFQLHTYIPSYVKTLIIVEKEGIFKKLLSDKFYNRVFCILVSGCGVPDISTRALVALITHLYPDLKIFCLTDFNVYGLRILFTYKFPTAVNCYETLGLSCPNIKWIGLRSHQIKELLSIKPDLFVQLQPLTKEDIAVSILLCSNLAGRDDCCNYIDELNLMLSCRYKMELETLYLFDQYALSRLLERCILCIDAI